MFGVDGFQWRTFHLLLYVGSVLHKAVYFTASQLLHPIVLYLLKDVLVYGDILHKAGKQFFLHFPQTLSEIFVMLSHHLVVSSRHLVSKALYGLDEALLYVLV